MTRLATDAHYDGGNLRGELSEREWDAQERQASADERSGELREALICITQAQGAMAVASSNTPKRTVSLTYQEMASDYLKCAYRYIRKAGGKE